MRGNHTRFTPGARRALALCLALVIVCSCVLPVFATDLELSETPATSVSLSDEETPATSTSTGTADSTGTAESTSDSESASSASSSALPSDDETAKTVYHFWYSTQVGSESTVGDMNPIPYETIQQIYTDYALNGSAEDGLLAYVEHSDWHENHGIVLDMEYTDGSGTGVPATVLTELEPVTYGGKTYDFAGWVVVDKTGSKEAFLTDWAYTADVVDVAATWTLRTPSADDLTVSDIEGLDGVTISVSDPNNALPAGAKLTVGSTGDTDLAQKAADLGATLGDNYAVYALDLSLGEDDAGKALEPDGAVTVTVTGIAVSGDLQVYHNGEKIAADYDNGTITFTTDSFSPFYMVDGNAESSIVAYDEDGTQLTDISAKTTYVQVGKTISLTGSVWGGTWTSSDESIATVTSSGYTATVKGVSAGTVTITHTYTYRGWTYTETITIFVTEGKAPSSTEKAIIYYLKKPSSQKDSNDSGDWSGGHNGWVATLDAAAISSSAKWEKDKNILTNVNDYIFAWPDESSGAGNWRVTRGTTYFNDAFDELWEQWQGVLQDKFGLIAINKSDVESFELKPYKISRNNGSNPDKHIDCEIASFNTKTTSVTITKAVQGSKAEKNREFTFKVKTSKTDRNGNATDTLTLSDTSKGSADSFKLKDDESVTIEGISVGTVLTITEPKITDTTNPSYETTATGYDDTWKDHKDGGANFYYLVGTDGKLTPCDKDGEALSGATALDPNITVTNKRGEESTSITLTKKLTGNYAEAEKAFSFAVTSGTGTITDTLTFSENTSHTGTPASFTLTDGDSVTIDGFTVGSVVAITESDVGTGEDAYTVKADGYEGDTNTNGTATFYYKVGTDANGFTLTPCDENGNAIYGATALDNMSVTVTNSRTTGIDTGVALDSAPYVLMLGVTAAAAVLTIRRRKD